jgi:TetR/AcrR family transcriptional regulator, fatty acid metabolism regulator protein
LKTTKSKSSGKRNHGRGKHEKILKAAIRVFAKNGFHNSKISQIAKEAGVADGTIYLYFKNKDDILIRLFEEKLDEINTELEQELATMTDPRDKFRHFVRKHLTLAEKTRPLAEVLSVELRQSNKFMKEYHPQKFGEYLNVLSRIIREGKEVGIFRSSVMPGIVKRSIFGALDEMVLFWVLTTSPKYDLDTVIDQVSDFFLDGLTENAPPKPVDEPF